MILADRSLNKQYTFDQEEKSVNEYNLPERLFSNDVNEILNKEYLQQNQPTWQSN